MMDELITTVNKTNFYSKISNITQKWVDVLTPYLNNYAEIYSESDINNFSDVPQQTISRIFSKLLKIGLLDFKLKGKNKLFFLPENINSKIIIKLLENHRALDFNMNNPLIVEEIIKNSETVIVFGSYASKTEKKDSDIDLIILGKTNKNQITKIKAKSSLEINEHYSSYLEFEKLLKQGNYLSLEVLKNHVIFGNVSKVVDLFWRHYYD